MTSSADLKSMSIQRRERRADRMRHVRVFDDYNDYEDQGLYAHVHGVLLEDPGSCEVPEGTTLTLEEWRAQQSAA